MFQGHCADDLDDLAIGQPGSAHSVELSSRDIANVVVQYLRERNGSRGLRVPRRAAPIQ